MPMQFRGPSLKCHFKPQFYFKKIFVNFLPEWQERQWIPFLDFLGCKPVRVKLFLKEHILLDC